MARLGSSTHDIRAYTNTIPMIYLALFVSLLMIHKGKPLLKYNLTSIMSILIGCSVV